MPFISFQTEDGRYGKRRMSLGYKETYELCKTALEVCRVAKNTYAIENKKRSTIPNMRK